MTVATLGIAVNSGPAVTGLRNLETAAKRAGITVEEMQARVNKASAGAAAAGAKMAASAAAQSPALAAASRAAAGQAESMSRLSTSTVQAASAMDKFATNLTRMVVIGAITEGVRRLTRYMVELGGQLAKIGDVSQRLGISTGRFQGLEMAAGGMGIGSNEFLDNFLKFGREVDRAKVGIGDLNKLLQANGQSAGDVETSFFKVADLIKNARNDMQKFSLLQQAGLPPTLEWVRLMEQGGDSLRDAVEEATKLGTVTDDTLIRRAKAFDDEWAKAVTRLSLKFRAFATDVIGWFADISSAGTAALIKITSLLPEAIRPDIGRNILRNSMNNDVGSRLSQNEANTFYDAVGLGGKGGKTTVNPGDQIKTQKTAFDSAVNSISRHIAAMNADAAAVGKTAAEHARLRVEAQLVEAGLRSGLSEAAVRSSEKFKELGQAAQDAAQKLALARVNDQIKFDRETSFLSQQDVSIAQALRDIYGNDVPAALASSEAAAMRMNDAMRDLSGSIENSISTGLSDLVSGSKSAKDAFSDMADGVVKAIQKMIIQMMIVQPLMRGLQGALGGIFGPGAPLNILPNALGGVFPANDNGISRYSNQIVSHPTIFPFARGVGLMGEAGPEAIMPLKRAPDGSLGVSAQGGRGGAPVINIINQSSGKVEQGGVRQNADGSIDVFIRDAVRGVMLDDVAKDGDISRAMSARIAGFNGR